jgi:tetratricopeptide (TPR) repeat protein
MFPEQDFTDSAVLADALLGGLRPGEHGASNPAGWIVLSANGNNAFGLVSQLEQRFLAAEGTVITAGWREGLLRPYGALLDIVEELAAWAQPRQPELLQRFGWSLVNLLYPWRKTEAELPVGELRAGLADLVFRGDQTLIHQFFQKRNVRPQILSYLIHFLLETTSAIAATTSGPVLLCLEDAHLADELSLSAVQLFNRYARSKRVPVAICMIADATPVSAIDGLLENTAVREEWRVARLNSTTASKPLETALERLTSGQRAALQVAAVFALPFNLSSWIEILPADLRATAKTSIEDFVTNGVLRRVGNDRLRFASGQLRNAMAETLTVEERVNLHARALESEESKDIFVAAWHATEGRCIAELRRYCLQAMERAWAVSAYESALTFAERGLAAPADDSTLDENLLLAMLNYEAGRYDEAHRRLAAALEHPSGQLDPNFLEYLLGYNAVFGIADYKQGIEILNRVVNHYEQKGDERGIAYIRNSLAFAHFCSRNVDEAISLEELNIDQLSRAQVSDSFLANVLQLNLGRLYRNSGEAERALKLLREGLFAHKAELSSHALLLYYGTLGNFQFAKGDYSASLESYYHSFEIIRNVQLDSVKDQVLLAFSKRVPELPPERTTRADLLLYYIHFHLGLTLQKLGLNDRADTYLAAIRQRADLFGASAVKAVEAAFMKESPPQVDNGKPPENFDENVTQALNSLGELVSEVSGEGSQVEWIVNALRTGQVVAIVHPHELGNNVRVMESLVLYDPSHRELGERMAQELESGGSHIKRAAAALFLPESAALFQDVSSLPLIQQSATLKPQYRAKFPALLPVKLCVQMLSPKFDDLLFAIIRGFGNDVGNGLVAAAPFHLWRRDLVATAQQAVLSFLVSSIDALLVGDRLLRKVHGSTAVENLLNFRPRLSEEALLIKGGNDSANGSNVLIRIKRRGGYATDDLLKLHPGTRPILDLCDGSLSVAELTQRAGLPQSDNGDEQLCAFLRSLWHRGALCFDEPVIRNAKGVG